MTTEPIAPAEFPPAPGGTVFDIGYQKYTGRREGRGRARLAIYKDGVRTALGLGRGPRAKALPWLFISLLCGIAVIMASIAGATDRLVGPGAAEMLDLPSHADFYGFASLIMFVFAAVVAPELLVRHRAEGTINLYLVRPLTGSDYVIARWAAFLTVMLGAAWLPQVILLLGLSLGDPFPVGYLRDNWRDIPSFLAAGAAMAAYTTSLALLTASFTTRRAYASVFLVGLFVVTTPLTAGLTTDAGGITDQWVSMFSLTNIPLHVNDLIFGTPSQFTAASPAAALPASIRLSWYLAWTAIPAAILWARYRRLTP